jgi:large subunit ribosomal protein L21
MYAIVEIVGQQFKIEKDQQIFVNRLQEKEGSKVDFDKVLLLDNSGKINVGAPVIKGAKVTAKVLEHLKGDKIIVFKKKRRKGYKVKNGFRQYLTKLEILSIDEQASKVVKSIAKAAPVKKAVAKKSASKAVPASKAVAKKLASKAVPAKKAIAKKSASKAVPAKKAIAKKSASKAVPVKKNVVKKSE